MNDVIVFTDLGLGEKARLTRLSKNLRQVDVASLAHCQPSDIGKLEKDRWIPYNCKIKILMALGLEDDARALLPHSPRRRRRGDRAD